MPARPSAPAPSSTPVPSSAPALPRQAQEEMLSKYLKYTVSMSRGDEDLRQELALAVWDAIQQGTPESKIVVHVWRRRSRYYEGYLAVDKCGRSLDRGNKDQRRPDARAPLHCGDGDEPLDPIVMEAVSEVWNPARLALFNIAYERFMDSLTPTERKFWELRAAGFRHWDCARVWPQPVCTKLKRRLRERFRQIVES